MPADRRCFPVEDRPARGPRYGTLRQLRRGGAPTDAGPLPVFHDGRPLCGEPLGPADRPFRRGTIVNAYNDGPTETRRGDGPVYEIETSSPAAFLRPGETLCHTQEVFHLQGDEALLEELLRGLIPGGLRAVKEAFNY